VLLDIKFTLALPEQEQYLLVNMATLKNSIINDTGYFTLPVGNTAQRPNSPTSGMWRYNTTLNCIEWYDPSTGTWKNTSEGPSISVEYLVVAGGGGGSSGAGGAGGLLTGTITDIAKNSIYIVTVGGGGNGGSASGGGTQGVNGSNSVFGTLTAVGGGAGDYWTAARTANSGGSGAGGSGNPGYRAAGGTGTQPSQPGASGTYGFGFPGGQSLC
jgi:hypothetical protein